MNANGKAASPEWQSVYQAGIAFVADPGDRPNQITLSAAIINWMNAKRISLSTGKARGFYRRLKTFAGRKPRGFDWVVALETELDQAEQAFWRSNTSREAQTGLTIIEGHQGRIRSSVLSGAQLWYRSGASDLYTIGSSAIEVTSGWQDVHGEETITDRTATQLGLDPVKQLFFSLFHGIEEHAKELAYAALKEVIGQQVIEELQKAIPYAGLFAEGKAVIDTAKLAAQVGWSRYKASKNAPALRAGTAEAALTALQTLLSRQLKDLSVDLAASATNFTVGVVSTAATGTDLANKISHAATATAKLLWLVYVFGREWYEVHNANKILESNIFDDQIFSTCPLLGAQLIIVANTSDLMSLALRTDQGLYRPSTTRGQREIEEIAKKISALKVLSIGFLSSSRFEVIYTPPLSLKDRIATFTGLRVVPRTATIRSSRDSGHVFDQTLYERRRQEEAQMAEAIAAEARKREGIEAAQRFSTAHIIRQQSKELEHRQALEEIEKKRQQAEEEAAINARELQEIQDREERAKMEKLAKLSPHVRVAINYHKQQTTGIRWAFTRPSQESLAARSKLEQLMASHSLEELERHLKWFLSISPFSPDGSSKQLKNPSRFRSLLFKAYSDWMIELKPPA